MTFSEFKDFFKNYPSTAVDDLKALYGIARIKKYSRGDFLVTEGQVFPYAIFVLKGLVRNYMISSKGDEKTLKFTDKGNPTAVPECIFNGSPSPEFIQALEDSTVIILDEIKFQALAKNKPRLLLLKIGNMGKALCEMAERIRIYTILTPEERYLDLIKRNKSLVERVEDRHLASYIGVTTISFSRIKTRTK